MIAGMMMGIACLVAVVYLISLYVQHRDEREIEEIIKDWRRELADDDWCDDWCCDEGECDVGDWMLEWQYDCMILEKIAVPERGYPVSEAKYPDIEAWEAATGKVFFEVYEP